VTGADLSEGDANLTAQRATWRSGIGPAAQALVERDERVFLKQSLSTPCLSAVRRAEGIWIEDADGHRLMDFHGNGVHHLGHGHPRVKAAIVRQLSDLPFAPRRFTCEPAVALAERLVALAPPGLTRVLFAPGGSEAIEIALKLVRVATGRHKTLSFWDAFHGAGLGASGVGGEALFRDSRLGPMLPGAEHVAPFACFRCPYGFPAPGGVPDLASCRMACARAATFALDRERDIGAVVAEPVRAIPYLPPAGFWTELRSACDRHATHLVFDEIPSGLGRTGRMFACEHSGVAPDILVLGKALGGGMLPLAAVLARGDLDVAGDLSIGHYTHEKNPLLAAAGLATLDVIRDDGLVERAAELGAAALDRLREMAATRRVIADIRGLGMLIGVELAMPDGTPATAVAESVLYAALARGLSFKVTQGCVLTLAPPLVIGREELDRALTILAAAVDDATAAHGLA
jgi:4-aminobutyrate aminotransferase